MKYPMFKVHIDKKQAMSNLNKVLGSGFFNEGIQVKEFERKLSKKMNIENILLTNSCTSALTLALKLSNVAHGDEVISTSMTCLATNTPILNLGAKIIWADIDPNTGNICPKDVELKITSKTKAVMCVNWAGLPCELEKLMQLCKKHNIKLIQDAAHSFGSLYNDEDISKFAHFTCFSFQAIKHITCGDGGALICLNKDDLSRAKRLKWFGLDRDATKDKTGEWKGQRWEHDVVEAGYKFNMNNITAAIGLSQIEHIDKIIKKHKDNALIYNEIFKNCEKIKPLSFPQNSSPSYWVYTLLIDENFNRDEIIQELNSMGIGAGLVHIPNHNYTCFAKSICKLSGVNYFHKNQISLPCGWWLDYNDIKLIANALLNQIKNRVKND